MSTEAAKSRMSNAERAHREKKRRWVKGRRSTERTEEVDSLEEVMWMGSASSSCRHSRRVNRLRTPRTCPRWGRWSGGTWEMERYTRSHSRSGDDHSTRQ